MLFLKAEKYGQFADSTSARVSTQEREKQKGVEKRQTTCREIKYYRQGMMIISLHCSYYDKNIGLSLGLTKTVNVLWTPEREVLACVASVSVQFGSKELQGDGWSE